MEPLPDAITPEVAALLHRLKVKYGWDMKAVDALEQPMRVLRRAMNYAVPKDQDEMEQVVGRALLVHALESAQLGNFLPARWRYWHQRLGLVAPGAEPPPMPSDRYPTHGNTRIGQTGD